MSNTQIAWALYALGVLLIAAAFLSATPAAAVAVALLGIGAVIAAFVAGNMLP